MNINDYQEQTTKYRLPSYGAEAAVMGLLSESGEVAGVFQKLLRGDYGPDVAASKLAAELGDILWHVASIANDNNWKLGDLCQENLNKLESRQIRGKIIGSGDDR
jgi:NTP pyrophosphatase (non-canonical NTP hydrolase)